MRLTVLLTAIVALSACDADRAAGTKFTPGPDRQTFTFEAQANNIFPVNSKDGEAHRMRYLEKWLSDNSICPNGYRITGRDVIYATGALYNITYRGECT